MEYGGQKELFLGLSKPFVPTQRKDSSRWEIFLASMFSKPNKVKNRVRLWVVMLPFSSSVSLSVN